MIAAAALALALAAQPGPTAEVVSAAPDSVTITLYREGNQTSRELQENAGAADRGLVMVTETRTVDVPAGTAQIAFRGVADGMIPQTAALAGLEGGVAEQNFDYDLLTPGALLARSLGGTVRVVRTNPATGRVTDERAVIRSAPQGVVLDIGGRIESLGCSGLPERLVFEQVPDGLADRPTLSVRTREAAAGRRTLTLSYLATGLAWSADYVARLSPDGRSIDLTGWLTLANGSNTTFGNAPTRVVAGDLAREDVERIAAGRIARQAACWPDPVRWPIEAAYDALPPPPPPAPMMSAPAFRGEDLFEIVVTGSRVARQTELGDYKLYTLPERTTVQARQVKQVRFLERGRVPVDRVYTHRLEPGDDTGPTAAEVMLRLRNTVAGGLGVALPAGMATVFEPGAGRIAYVGEDRLEDAPVGLPVEIELAEASDIIIAQTVTAEDDLPGDRVRRAHIVDLTNAKPYAVRLELRLEALDGLRIVREDARHVRKDGAPLWTLDLAPNSRRTFRYTAESDD